MDGLDVYVLGAGASYVHGAPLLDELLPRAFGIRAQRRARQLVVVARFLEDVFLCGPRVRGATARFPSLVDALSVVDMALDRKENLADRYDEARLREVRASLEYAIFHVLEYTLSGGGRARRSQATRDLVRRLDPASSVILSFNYDVIVDIALSMRHQRAFRFDRGDVEMLSAGDLAEIDYGVHFANVDPRSLSPHAFRLFKLHGSFNWLLSRRTGDLYFGGMQKAVGPVLRRDRDAGQAGNLWRAYESIGNLQPVMVTPTHLKDLRNVHLAGVWRRAEEAVRAARRITFIGYSLPGDDLHVKYLFKRAIQTRRGAAGPRIVVVDLAKGRKPTAVEERYRRFFGPDVAYYRKGFARYVAEEIRPVAGSAAGAAKGGRAAAPARAGRRPRAAARP